ncbi:Uncharacterized protein HZ326_18455 [Fusarium oxysporum f. sp. albedinis]|nr:Uncharacterized protein HZ326_18455 [Fusarium oxysporum f. sp. albedinis]
MQQGANGSLINPSNMVISLTRIDYHSQELYHPIVKVHLVLTPARLLHHETSRLEAVFDPYASVRLECLLASGYKGKKSVPSRPKPLQTQSCGLDLNLGRN